ncbi:hypothetical protein HOY80DRAFT_1044564 [Tuber brumale]|nr:hypothetical protein HOY80DRAFT_1066965 [Tuber brumale]KAG0639549.1 hypothetical protein HOY80DRAFT_1044564 [Tuber brumale]
MTLLGTTPLRSLRLLGRTRPLGGLRYIRQEAVQPKPTTQPTKEPTKSTKDREFCECEMGTRTDFAVPKGGLRLIGWDVAAFFVAGITAIGVMVDFVNKSEKHFPTAIVAFLVDRNIRWTLKTLIVLGTETGEPGVKDVHDVGSECAGVLAWRCVIGEGAGARMNLQRDLGSGHLAAIGGSRAMEWCGLQAIVVGRLINLLEKVSKLFDDTLFFPPMLNIYFANLHQTPGAPAEKNRAQ